MSDKPEFGIPMTWPDGVPAIVPLMRSDSRELSREISDINRRVYGDYRDADRVAAVYREAHPDWPEAYLGHVAHTLAYTRARIAPEAGRPYEPTQVEYSNLVIEQAYDEHDTWNAQNPGWSPPPQRAERRKHDAVSEDPLTRLLNRRGLDERLEQMRGWCREAPPGKKRFMLLLQIDLDDFKRVNDTHGHEGGDRLLEDVADGIRSNTDVIGSRPGGDEFNVAFVTEVDDSEVPEEMSDEEMRQLLQALPKGHRDDAGIIAARRAQGFARRLESLLDQVMSSSASAMWLKAGLSAADRVRPEPGASIGFAVGGSWERKDDTKRRADGAMYARKRERKLVKALAKNAAARQELEELGVMELLGWMIEALNVVTDPINQALLRTLLEIRGDREPSTETR